MIQGGWGYVGAAYAVAWGGLAFYALSLFLRRRAFEPPAPTPKEPQP